MYLYFLRHGLAGQHGDPQYKDDSLRPLTKEGQEKMSLEAQGMKKLGLDFDCIISSPYLRAQQTAQSVALGYQIKDKNLFLTEKLLPPASIEELLEEVKQHFPKAENILLVGHEPHLSQMVSALLKSKTSLSIDFKKGGLCCVELTTAWDTRNALLLWLMAPKQLVCLGS